MNRSHSVNMIISTRSSRQDETLLYRPDIDGLRAVAVCLVIIYHAGLWPAVTGGFIGVDVFFVISGYLITSIIRREIQAGNFSIIRFYERRVRRIFPVLIAVVISCCIAAFLTFPPLQLRNLAASAVSATGFYSNHFFLAQSGYFEPATAQLPLLHTWSLAVEEQFYLLMPLLLLALVSMSWRIAGVSLWAIAVTSLFLSGWMVRVAPEAAFYILPSRAWELMIGALVAMGSFPLIQNQLWRELFAASGLLFIIGAACLISLETPFPGWAALLPCLGAAAIIQSGSSGSSLTKKLLSLAPFTATGKISYSLYLWHWPILVFLRYSQQEEPAASYRWAAVAFIFCIASLSWAFVEEPFRKKNGVVSQRGAFVCASAAFATMFAFSNVMRMTDGLPYRFPTLANLRSDSGLATIKSSCAAPKQNDGGVCALGAPGKTPDFLLWGDSHAYRSATAFGTAGREVGKAGILAFQYSCPPFLNIEPRQQLSHDACPSANAKVMKLIKDHQIKHVFLLARWAAYVEKPLPLDKISGQLHADDGNFYAAFRSHLRDTIRVINQAGARVTIVASVPEINFDVPSAIAKEYIFGATIPETSRKGFLERQKFIFESFEQIKSSKVDILYPHTVLCGIDTCYIQERGFPLYIDSHHLSGKGALKMVPLIAGSLAKTN